MILSKKRKTKGLISLRGRAGWSVPVLFANSEDRFPCVKVHILIHKWYIAVQWRITRFSIAS